MHEKRETGSLEVAFRATGFQLAITADDPLEQTNSHGIFVSFEHRLFTSSNICIINEYYLQLFSFSFKTTLLLELKISLPLYNNVL